MESKLRGMFEYQRFEGNSRLAKMIADTESRYAKALSDDDLMMVNAAGELNDTQGMQELGDDWDN